MKNRQQKVLDFIAESIKQNGYPPTVREITLGVGLKSSSTVAGHLVRLREKGLVTWDPYVVRTIRILDSSGIYTPNVVIEDAEGLPVAIEWQGRRYVYDPG